MNEPTCARCSVPIVDRSTLVERGGRTFCCGNCAAAMQRAETATDEVPAPR